MRFLIVNIFCIWSKRLQGCDETWPTQKYADQQLTHYLGSWHRENVNKAFQRKCAGRLGYLRSVLAIRRISSLTLSRRASYFMH